MSDMFKDVWGRTFIQAGLENGERVKAADVWARSPAGNPNRAITETLYGLNHRSLANSIPINRDYYGLAFFTKPDLRLTQANILRVRRFAPMLTARETSLPRAIRAMLDFRHTSHNEETYPCPLIDPKQIFIPLLTNQLISMSGWQDVELPTHTSDKGVYGEEYSFADGIADVYRCFDITCNFRNIPGDPVTALFYYWILYAQHVYEGSLSPYHDNIAENVIDYQTRIYRVILDSSKRFVQKIACTGAAFPTSVPLGANFNFEIDQPINRNDQIAINFRSIGAEYNDDIIIRDFNAAVVMGNEDMADGARQAASMTKVPYEYIFLFNYLGYPRINIETFELEWWVYNNKFVELTGQANNPQPTTQAAEFNIDDVDAGDLNTYTGGPISGAPEAVNQVSGDLPVIGQPPKGYIDPKDVIRQAR